MNAILSLFLSLIMLLAPLFTAVPKQPEAVPALAATEPTETVIDRGDSLRSAAQTAAEHIQQAAEDDLAYADMAYVHYDPEPFYADLDSLRSLAAAGDAEGVCGVYDSLYDELICLDTLSVLAMLRHDADFYDEYWSEEYAYVCAAYDELEDEFLTACGEVLDTDVSRAFTRHVGQDTAAVFQSYDSDVSYDAEAAERELELLDEYYALYDGINDLTTSYRGETWTFDDLYGYRGDALAWKDYDAYLDVYSGLHKAMNEAFAPVYIELVRLWTAEARSAGYDSYADYAYENLYVREYTTADAQAFCDAVKPIAREYYEDLYYSDLYFEAEDARPAYSGEELLAILGDYLPRIDESLLGPWETLTDRGLYDLADMSSGRYDGAYTTILLHYDAPFLYAALEGSARDLITLTHEFGHFCDYCFTPVTNIITQSDDLDLSEIHSNALQGLFSAFYGEIFTRHADAVEFADLSDLMENVIDGCFYDEFQRRVFAAADDLTPERLNDIYLELCAEYGMYEPGYIAWDSGWAYIAHNFAQPMYYISYAASGMAAIQIWAMAQTDFRAAVDTYLAVLRRGSYDAGYCTVLTETGLRLFTEDGAVAEVCRPLLDRLTALDRNA